MRTPDNDGPWAHRMEEHLGDPAYSIFSATGQRIAVGLTERDAAFICDQVNRDPAA